MKKLLLFTTALLLSLSAWTQDLVNYRALFPKKHYDFEVIDIQQISYANRFYVLVRFKGTYLIEDISSNVTLESPPDKNAFAVLKYRSSGVLEEVIAQSLPTSNCSVSYLRFVKSNGLSFAVMGYKEPGKLDITGSYNDEQMSINCDSSGVFFAHFKHLSIKHLKSFPSTDTVNSLTINSYFVNSNDLYFVFAGSFSHNLTIGNNVLSSPYNNTPFIAKVHIYGSDLTNYEVSFAKKLNIQDSESGGYIKSLAINNSDIVVIGDGYGTIDMNPNPYSTQNLVLGGDKWNRTMFIGRYSKTDCTYKAKHKSVPGTDIVNYNETYIVSDNDNNFYISYKRAFRDVVNNLNADFKSNSSAGSVSGSGFLAKYDSLLNFQWNINNIYYGYTCCPKIGINNNGDLCVLTPFNQVKNFNPNGTPTYYTCENWAETDPFNYFLGRYNTADGTLITGNTMKVNDQSATINDFFLGTDKTSSRISVVTHARKVDYDLGIGEEIVAYPKDTWFFAGYDPCEPTIINNSLLPETVCEGSELLSTSISASGTGDSLTFRYRWYKDDELLQNGTFDEGLITNSNTRQLKITNTTPLASGNYQLEATSRCDIPRFSNEAIFTVTPKTHITQEPNGQIVCEGASASFSVSADNNPTYQWQVNDGSGGFVNMPGKTSATLNLNDVDLNMAGYQYRCKVTGQDNCNELYSNTVNLGVKATPQIQAQPQANTETCEGTPATISVVTDGAGLSYQWQVSTNNGSSFSNISNGANYSGTQDATLDINNPTLNDNDNIYRCVVSGDCGSSVTSNEANLSVKKNVQLVSNPQNKNICQYEETTFNVNAEGDGLEYAWQIKNGSNWVNLNNDNTYSNVNNPSLSINSAGTDMNGNQYRCRISSPCSTPIYSTTANLNVTPTPMVTLSSSEGSDICEGNTTTLSSDIGAGSYTYQWKRNFSPVSGASNSTLIANQSGAYTLYVEENVSGCTFESDPIILNVHALPNNTTTLDGSNQLCEGESRQLTVPAGNGYTYQWYQNGNPMSSQTSHSLFVNASGTYHAKIISDYACENTSSDEIITVNANPTVNLTSQDAEFCEGEQATINATTNTDYTYLWRRNGVVLTGETTDVLQTNQAGAYSVEVVNTVTSCSAVSDPLSVSVHALPNNNITLIGSPVFCEGLSAGLTVPAGNGYAYEWYKDNTLISGQTSNSLTVTESGAYHAQINNAYGCQNTSEDKVITVSPSPNVSLTIVDSELCQGEETTISTEENSDYFYQWLHNNNEMPGETSYSVQVSEAGLYKVSVINTATGCSGISDYTVISVNPLPNPELSVSGDLTVCVEDSVELSLNESYSQYLWQDQSSNDNLYISESGVYSVTVTDENNCQNSAEIEINEILVPTPDICMVTVDTAINRNLIIWENVPNARGIASYNVYKLAANTYQLLGNIQYGDTTEFVDMTSEPHIHSDKYVIASVDSCGNVGEYSPYHQTMNLSIVNGAGDDADNGVVLIWTKYIDESGFNNPTEYEIYRGVDELTYHASVTGGLSDYNYNIPDAEEGEHFLIVVQRPSGCFPLNGVNELKANGGPYYNSISNMEDEGLLISGIKNTESGLFRIYPNPAKDKISIESDNNIERIRILDISGKVLLEQKANAEKAFNLDLSDFAKGLYFIEVNGQKAKLIKE